MVLIEVGNGRPVIFGINQVAVCNTGWPCELSGRLKEKCPDIEAVAEIAKIYGDI